MLQTLKPKGVDPKKGKEAHLKALHEGKGLEAKYKDPRHRDEHAVLTIGDNIGLL